MPLPKFNFGAHFLTAVTFERRPFFAQARCAELLCEELECARQKFGFAVIAFVVMPDHLYLLVWWDTERLPALTVSKVAWAVKGRAARRVVEFLKEAAGVGEGNAFAKPRNAFADPRELLVAARTPRDQAHYRNWQYKVWQQGAGYDFNVYSEAKLGQKIAYIHANPVRAGLVSRAEDYRWSSAAPDCDVKISWPGR
jgi:putative transposase